MADKTYFVKITTQAEEQLQAIVKYLTVKSSTIEIVYKNPHNIGKTQLNSLERIP
jgi:hypothetical protein